MSRFCEPPVFSPFNVRLFSVKTEDEGHHSSLKVPLDYENLPSYMTSDVAVPQVATAKYNKVVVNIHY